MNLIDWIPSLSTTGFFALLLWFTRNAIIARINQGIKHEYDSKIEEIKHKYDCEIEEVKAQLYAKQSQIEALSGGVLSNITERKNLVFKRQLTAIDELWSTVISLAPIKTSASIMAHIKYEYMLDICEKKPECREFFSAFASYDLKSIFKENKAVQSRPFVSPMIWAYFSAYNAILMNAALKYTFIKFGLNEKELTDPMNAKELAKIVLPNHTLCIGNTSPTEDLYFLIEELEKELLNAFQQMLQGKDNDSQTVAHANEIMKLVGKLQDQNNEAIVKSENLTKTSPVRMA